MILGTLSLTNLHAAEKTNNINLELKDATLKDLSELVIKGLLNSDYVIDPNLLSDNRKFTLSLKDATPDTALNITLQTLNQYGLEIVTKDGIKHLQNINQQQQIITTNTQPTNDLNDENNQQIINQLQPQQKETITHYKSKYRNLDDTSRLLNLIGIKSASDGDTIYIVGDSPRLTAAINLLRNYDKPIDDIVIKASVIEFNDSANSGFNIFAFLSSKNLSLSAGTNLLMRDSIRFVTTSFSFVLSKIEEDSRFNVLNTSIQRVVNGKQSRLSIGSDVPVLSQFSQTNNGQPIQNIEYRSSGLILDVLPRLINNQVTADLTQELSSFAETTSSTINSPTLTKRQMKTSLSAKLNEVILIGGLETSQINTIKSTIFGLPIGSTNRENKSTLYLLIEFSRI